MLREAQVLAERWRRHYNTMRPHSSLGYRPPAPEAIAPWPPGSATLSRAPGPADTISLTLQLVPLAGAAVGAGGAATELPGLPGAYEGEAVRVDEVA